jgi:deoxyribonuclease-4
MRFGAHVSAAGGLWNAAKEAKTLGCEVIQIFSRPPQGGQPKAITEEDAQKFKAAMTEASVQAVYIHSPYFINLASSNPRIEKGSVSVLRQELERGTQLGCQGMMFHPGSAKDVGPIKGKQMVIEGLNRILDGYNGSCQLLIEMSAGAGEVMGDEFEELAEFIEGTERGKEIGICFDTQHAFASGYDLRTKEAVDETFKLFDKIIGLKKLVASHCNDSKIELGGKKDRHEHWGEGHIGLKGLEAIIRHPKLQHLDLILETPWEKGDKTDPRLKDVQILKKLRG